MEIDEVQRIGKAFALKRYEDDECYRVGRLLEDIADRVLSAEGANETLAEEKEELETQVENLTDRVEDLEKAYRQAGDLGTRLIQLHADTKPIDPDVIPFDAAAFEAKGRKGL